MKPSLLGILRGPQFGDEPMSQVLQRTLPETNLFASENWMVGILASFWENIFFLEERELGYLPCMDTQMVPFSLPDFLLRGATFLMMAWDG